MTKFIDLGEDGRVNLDNVMRYYDKLWGDGYNVTFVLREAETTDYYEHVKYLLASAATQYPAPERAVSASKNSKIFVEYETEEEAKKAIARIDAFVENDARMLRLGEEEELND